MKRKSSNYQTYNKRILEKGVSNKGKTFFQKNFRISLLLFFSIYNEKKTLFAVTLFVNFFYHSKKTKRTWTVVVREKYIKKCLLLFKNASPLLEIFSQRIFNRLNLRKKIVYKVRVKITNRYEINFTTDILDVVII